MFPAFMVVGDVFFVLNYVYLPANIYLRRKRWILAHPAIIPTDTRDRNCTQSLRAVTWKIDRFYSSLKAGKILGPASSVLAQNRFNLLSLPLIGSPLLETIPEDVRENERHVDTSWLGQLLPRILSQFLPEKKPSELTQVPHYLGLTLNIQRQ